MVPVFSLVVLATVLMTTGLNMPCPTATRRYTQKKAQKVVGNCSST
jgi:hypothetical protein